MELICRLRDDANLNYLYLGKQNTGRERNRKYDGKINVKKMDRRKIKKEYVDESVLI